MTATTPIYGLAYPEGSDLVSTAPVRRVHKRVRLYARAFCLYKKAGALAREAAPVVHASEGNKLGRKLVRAFAYYHKAALFAHKRAAFAEFIQHPASKGRDFRARQHSDSPRTPVHRS